MASRHKKLNVLVYTGPGANPDSIRHCITSLRGLLQPNYAITPILPSTLLNEPWTSSTALIIFPGGADSPYCHSLNGPGNRLIADFVRGGGAYLGFCAGGYYGSALCEFEVGSPKKGMEVVESRELAFFPGTCRGGAFEGFEYNRESGARAARLKVRKGRLSCAETVPDEFRCYWNGGGVFVGADGMEKVEVLADYEDGLAVDGEGSKAAVVYSEVGQGCAIVTGPHPEFSADSLRRGKDDPPGYDELIAALKADEKARLKFLRACLTKLGLEVGQETTGLPALTRMHLSALEGTDVADLLLSFQDIITKAEENDANEHFIRGEHDLFLLEKADSRWPTRDLGHVRLSEYDDSGEDEKALKSAKDAADFTKHTKRIVSHEARWPASSETPHFNHGLYYASLGEFRSDEIDAEQWGTPFMYGEVVTSTNTLMDRNLTLLAKLPTGFTFAATTQVAGRGRGSNVWVSPAGCLIFSTIIKHAAPLACTRPVVFIPYLAAIAIVQSIHTYGTDRRYRSLPVRLKWPNDIYCRNPNSADEKDFVKIGGLLANCSYVQGEYQVVLGIGINTSNGRPTTSLDALLPLVQGSGRSLPPFRTERLLARVLTRLEGLYKKFLREGFSRELEETYYEHWLHSGQVVTLEAHEGMPKARILGITRDWGLLRAEELGTGKVWALQSDENGFDFFRGLVRRKI